MKYLEMEAALRQVLARAVEEEKAAGVSVVLLQDGKKVISVQEGFAVKEEAAPMREDTVFRLHSMTKPVLAAAALRLMQREKIGMEDPVGDYLPEYRQLRVAVPGGSTRIAARPMCVYHLLNMTSGLVYPDGETQAGREMGSVMDEITRAVRTPRAVSTREAARRMAQSALAFEPGRGWAYGVSADVLGALLEEAAGEELGKLIRKEILDPLDMGETGFGVAAENAGRLAAVYEETDGSLSVYDADELGLAGNAPAQPPFASGGAGLCGTLGDYAKFARMLLDEGDAGGHHLLQPEAVRFMTRASLTGVQQQAFDRVTMFSLGRYTYAGLLRKCLRDDVSPRLARCGEYGWGGQAGTDFVNFPRERAILLIGMQKRNARMYSLGKTIRAAVLRYLEE